MINMLRKAIKFSIQRVYFPQSYFESRHYSKRFNSIGKFKSLTFQLRAIYFHTFAVDMSVHSTQDTIRLLRTNNRQTIRQRKNREIEGERERERERERVTKRERER